MPWLKIKMVSSTRLANKRCALSEDRTHDLQITLIRLFLVIMRLTRYLLRYQGTYNQSGEVTSRI